MVKEYGNAPAVPTAVLMEVLRQELQVRRHGRRSAAALHTAPPTASFGAGAAAAGLLHAALR